VLRPEAWRSFDTGWRSAPLLLGAGRIGASVPSLASPSRRDRFFLCRLARLDARWQIGPLRDLLGRGEAPPSPFLRLNSLFFSLLTKILERFSPASPRPF